VTSKLTQAIKLLAAALAGVVGALALDPAPVECSPCPPVVVCSVAAPAVAPAVEPLPLPPAAMAPG